MSSHLSIWILDAMDLEADTRALPPLLLSLSSALLAGIHAGTAARGLNDTRPAHGFAFARLAPHGATVGQLADHLGVTKQAASQLVDELVGKGYVALQAHESDARARLVVLTERGWGVHPRGRRSRGRDHSAVARRARTDPVPPPLRGPGPAGPSRTDPPQLVARC